MANKKKQAQSLLSSLATESTSEARALLKKYTGKDARNYADLEYKLAQFYAAHPDKIQIEKEMALIHPHKDFILKHLAPKPVITVISEKEPIVEKVSNVDGTDKCTKETEAMSGFLNASGPLLASGDQSISGGTIALVALSIVGMIAIVATTGIILSHIKNK